MSRTAPFLSLIGVLLFQIGFTQTGPGGVGTTDGNSTLEVWLRAEDPDADGDFNNNPANGSQISTWVDYSGNNSSYSNVGNNRPTYKTTGAFDAIQFDASQTQAQFLIGANLGTRTPGSVFFAMNPIKSGNSNSLFDNPTFSLRVHQWANTNLVGYTRYGVADYRTNIASPFGINSILSFHKPNNNANILIRVNDNEGSLNIGSNTAGIPFDRIGRNSNGADEASGDFFEVILYSEEINLAQQIIVDNYLSAKYGGIDCVDDVYDEDDPGNGNYDHDVAGIGRWNGNNQHTDAQGTGILRILNPSNLNNNEYLMWGHDQGNLEFNSAVNIPSNISFRLERIWRASEVNRTGGAIDLGNIDMQFDLTNAGSFTLSDLSLLVDTDNDGSFSDETPIDGATDLGSNIFEFSNVSAIENNVRFTLGLKISCPTEVCVPMVIRVTDL